MDGIGTLFLICIVGFFIGRIFKHMKSSSQNGFVNDRNLTDTQRNFRKTMAAQDQDSKQLLLDNLVKSFTPFQRKTIEMSKYITQNLRPFRFYEWLFWSVKLNFLLSYGNMIFVIAGWIIFPLYIGLPVPFIVTIPIIIAMDLILYKRHRYYEVVKWDPEFTRKYGTLLEELKAKYK